MANAIEKVEMLTTQDAITIWNRANPEKLIKKFLPDFADQVEIRAYPNTDNREFDIIRFDEERFTLYDFFLKYKFNGDKTKCDAFVVKLISAHEEKKAKVSEDLMTEQKKAENEEIQANKEALPDVAWRGLFKLGKKNEIIEDLFNYELIVENELHVRKNDLTKQIEFVIPTWLHRTIKLDIFNDDDFVQTLSYINVKYNLKSRPLLETAIESVAARNSYHPIRDYFNSLPAWDGVKRLDSLMKEVLNAKEEFYEEDGQKIEYSSQVLKIFMTAAYRRAMSDRPVKFDTGLVLVGEQGKGKSTFARRLAADFYTNTLTIADIQDYKRAVEKIESCMFAEVQEVSFSSRRKEVDAVKGFMSVEQDHFRRAFGRRVETINRLAVFIMTTNDQSHSLLADSTGSRRFLIVETEDAPSEKYVWDVMTPEYVAQLWAELLDKDQHGGKSIEEETAIDLKPNSALFNFATRKANANLKTDTKEELVRTALTIPLPDNWDKLDNKTRQNYILNCSLSKIGKNSVRREAICTAEVWNEIYGKDAVSMTNSDAFAIKNVLTKLGLIPHREERKRFPGYGQQRNWYEIPTPEKWAELYPNAEYPFAFDPSDIPDQTEAENYYDMMNSRSQKETQLAQENTALLSRMRSALAALEKGNIEEAKKFLTSEEDLANLTF